MPNRWRDADFPTLLVATFVLLVPVAFALWPIQKTDTDLWYHLAAGRLMAETGRLPVDSSYLSFLQPPRPFADYYWLFQKLVYACWSWGGYLGLVLLRAAWAGTIAAGVAVLACGGRRPRAWTAALTVLAFTALIPRLDTLRPHLAEYLGIAIALSVLDLRPGWAVALPVAAALWGNLHGISYPVLLWLCGSFVAERLARRAPPEFTDRAFGATAVAMAAVFVTPLGADLLPVPFGLSERARATIQELGRLDLAGLFSLEVVKGTLTPSSAQRVLLALAALGALGALARRAQGLGRRRARAAHVLLFAGGLGLLWQGHRFFVEFVLFSLPLLRDNPPFEAPRAASAAVGRVVAAAAAIAVMLPIGARLLNRPAYPFSIAGLPAGTAEFLRREGGGGKLLSHPDNGGYWEWMLLPRYRITADMQMPFLFEEDDIFLALQAYSDPQTLGWWIDTYRPDFIEAPAGKEAFRTVIAKFPDFVPVFSDGISVLFASASRKPALAADWRLPVDPFDFAAGTALAAKDPKGWSDCRPRYIVRMLDAAPGAYAPRLAAAQACLGKGRGREAERDARRLIQDYPEAPVGYMLLADALEAENEHRGAADAYARALARGGRSSTLHLRLARAYDRLGLKDEAERHRRLGAPAAPNLPSASAEKSR
ncbi:MAG: hypothetical protein HY553_06440 [Elusimicrobia bacterium]|nr:hypothetical protein [Elusimicrobiota bacterium]